METKILVVDDEKEIRIQITELLTEFGFSVDMADSAKSAIKLINSTEYEVIITDKNMPGLDGNLEGGFDILSYIQKEMLPSEVIMMTGYANIETAIKAMKFGAFDYIRKPIIIEKLKEKIDRILGYKCFINPEKTIFHYKDLHNEIFDLLENKNSLNNEELHQWLKSLNKKIDHLFKNQQKFEKIIIEQREALSNISTFVEQLKDDVPQTNALYSLIDKISKEAKRRI